MIKTSIQRNHMFGIFALVLKDGIFGYLVNYPGLPRFLLIPNTDLKDGSCKLIVSYVSSTVIFFAI